jgi:hypothetical protein
VLTAVTAKVITISYYVLACRTDESFGSTWFVIAFRIAMLTKGFTTANTLRAIVISDAYSELIYITIFVDAPLVMW